MSQQTPSFELSFEELDDRTALLHCEVNDWDISVARRLDRAVNNLFDGLWEQGYKDAVTFSPNPRFCEYMGGEWMGEITWNGKHYEIFRWDLKPLQ